MSMSVRIRAGRRTRGWGACHMRFALGLGVWRSVYAAAEREHCFSISLSISHPLLLLLLLHGVVIPASVAAAELYER